MKKKLRYGRVKQMLVLQLRGEVFGPIMGIIWSGSLLSLND